MRLSNSFKINAKVLSVRHSTDLERRNKRFVKDTTIGYGKRGKDLRKRKPTWLFQLPENSQNNCLLQSLVVAYNHCLALEGKQSDFGKMKKLFGIERNEKKKAMELINLQSRELAENLGIASEGPHNIEDIAEKIINMWNCQLNFFFEGNGKWLESYPEDVDRTKRQMYFLTSYTQDEQIGHVDAIENITIFYRLFGTHCPYHRKTYTGKSYNHMCNKSLNFCHACNREKYSQGIYINSLEKTFYCFAEDDTREATAAGAADAATAAATAATSVPKICGKCNSTLRGKVCESIHQKKMCSRIYFCRLCEQKILLKGQSVKDVKKAHICGTKICTFCCEKIEYNHQCKLNKVSYQKEYTNLAFLHVQCSKKKEDSSSETNCFSSDKLDPIMCVLAYEEDERGMFKKKFFSSFHDYEHEQCGVMDYSSMLPKPLKEEPLSDVRWSVNFGRSKKRRLKPNVFKKIRQNVVVQLLDFILNYDFKNTTIITYGGASLDLQFVCKAMTSAGVIPHVVMNHQNIISLEFPDAGVRFIDCKRFLEGDLLKIAETQQKQAYFFPECLSHNILQGNIPSISEWMTDEDTPSITKAKTLFLQSIDSENWSWKKEILNYCLFKLEVTIEACLEFIATSFKLQNVLREELKPPEPQKGELFHLHPFNYPFVTKASFSYRLFRLYAHGDCKDLRVIKNDHLGVYIKSSSGELQWSEYMRNKYGNPDEFVFAFSSGGQKQCKHKNELVPDWQYKDEIGLFQGCFVHRHSREICSIMKNSKDTVIMGRDDDYIRQEDERKLTEYKKNHPEVKKVTIIYECEWNRLKKEDPKIMAFMESTYCQYPRTRLVPRSAGNFYLLYQRDHVTLYA